MASHASMSNAYDAFLFETLGVDEHGMDLSVLSALARAGVDPWAEAKKLAALPRQAAIAAITAILNLGGDGETARRLAELLPRSATPTQTAPSKKLIDRQTLFRKYGLVMIAAWLVAAVAFMMFSGSSNSSMPVPDLAGASASR
jgi:hypothetical protein